MKKRIPLAVSLLLILLLGSCYSYPVRLNKGLDIEKAYLCLRIDWNQYMGINLDVKKSFSDQVIVYDPDRVSRQENGELLYLLYPIPEGQYSLKSVFYTMFDWHVSFYMPEFLTHSFWAFPGNIYYLGDFKMTKKPGGRNFEYRLQFDYDEVDAFETVPQLYGETALDFEFHMVNSEHIDKARVAE